MTTAVAGRCCLNLLSAPPPLPALRSPPSSALHQIFSCNKRRPGGRLMTRSGAGFRTRCGLLPVDPWAPTLDSQSVASQLFAVSLFPYLGFLYYITKSNTAPKLTLFGFYFLLAFVGATSTESFLLRGTLLLYLIIVKSQAILIRIGLFVGHNYISVEI